MYLFLSFPYKRCFYSTGSDNAVAITTVYSLWETIIFLPKGDFCLKAVLWYDILSGYLTFSVLWSKA